ncbi:MAG: hypothetical protein JNK85_13000 [Verrucomicrobiales bacterium]|nr:hypothetical protein [Verrucomicrobiales bacterium]
MSRFTIMLRQLGFRGFALGAVALILSGCEVATSRQPIGSQPANLADLKVTGVWKAGQEHFYVRIADAEAGRLEVAQVKSGGGEFTIERTEMLVRRQDDALLVNLRSVSPESRSEYVFGRAVVNDGGAVIYLAGKKPIEAFARSAGIGIATRSIDEPEGDHDSIVVTNGFDRVAQELASPAGWQLLDFEHPLILQQE